MTADAASPQRIDLAERYRRLADRSAVRFSARWGLRVVLFGALFGFWELAVDLGWVREIIVPRPSSVAGQIDDVLLAATFPRNLSVTMRETLAGFALGAGSALGIAVLLTLFPRLRFFVTDYILALQAIPKVTLIPILITWFGQDEYFLGIAPKDKMILAALITFFPVYINAMVGMNTIAPDERRLMRGLGANRYQRLYMWQFPQGLPTIFSGFKNGITNAIIGAVIAEFLGATAGLGQLILILSTRLAVAEVFVVIGVLSIITVILYYIVDYLEKWIVFWAPRE
jgi:NitT/TauT family transport system permease protein